MVYDYSINEGFMDYYDLAYGMKDTTTGVQR